MCLPWINITPNLLEGTSLINSLSQECFTQMLKQDMKNEKVSIDEYVQHLKPTSNLKQSQLVLVVQTVRYILKQAFKIMLKPTTLHHYLTEDMNLEHEKADHLVKLWTEETLLCFNLDNRMKFENVSWDLNLGVASNVCNKEVSPHAKLQFKLMNTESGEKQDLILDLEEKELLSLYKTVENIQVKLDSIQNAACNVKK